MRQADRTQNDSLKSRVEAVASDVRRRANAGETVSYEAVLQAYSDLGDPLRKELQQLKLVLAAGKLHKQDGR